MSIIYTHIPKTSTTKIIDQNKISCATKLYISTLPLKGNREDHTGGGLAKKTHAKGV